MVGGSCWNKFVIGTESTIVSNFLKQNYPTVGVQYLKLKKGQMQQLFERKHSTFSADFLRQFAWNRGLSKLQWLWFYVLSLWGTKFRCFICFTESDASHFERPAFKKSIKKMWLGLIKVDQFEAFFFISGTTGINSVLITSFEVLRGRLPMAAQSPNGSYVEHIRKKGSLLFLSKGKKDAQIGIDNL